MVGPGDFQYLESKYKEQQKVKTYDFGRYSDSVTTASEDNNDRTKKKFNLKDLDFIDDRDEFNPIQTDTTDSKYLFDNEDAIVVKMCIRESAHIGMSIFRDTVDGLKLQDWLSKKIWPIEDNLTEQDIYYSSLYSCIEMIKTGTTTVNDHYFFPESVVSAISKSGMRGEVTRVLSDINNDLDGRVDEMCIRDSIYTT